MGGTLSIMREWGWSPRSAGLLVGSGTLLFALLVLAGRRRRHWPPGPRGLPLLGCINFGKRGLDDLEELANNYGEVVGLRILNKDIVILNSFRAMKEAFQQRGENVAGRPISRVRRRYNGRHLGLLFCEGDLWREQRRFALHTLRDLGLGTKVAEAATLVELEHMVAHFESQMSIDKEGRKVTKAISPRLPVTRAIANVISTLVFSERLAEDPEFEHISEIINNKLVKYTINIFVALCANLLEKLPGDMFGLKQFHRLNEEVHRYMQKKVEEHRKTFDPANIRDYIDAFLLEMQTSEAAGSSTSFTDNQLHQAGYDLFLAGQETTSSAVSWALLLLAKYPHVQKRVHAEIDSRLARDRRALFSDRALFPFCDSVMSEVLRFAAVVFNAHHKVLVETEVCGYRLPPGTLVFGNVYRALHDQALWPSGRDFNPEANFPLGPAQGGQTNGHVSNGHVTNGQVANGHTESSVDPSDEFGEGTVSSERSFRKWLVNDIPFGVGKRICLGQRLAQQEFFILFMGLLQKFEVRAAPECPLPDEHCGANGITRPPPPFKIQFVARY